VILKKKIVGLSLVLNSADGLGLVKLEPTDRATHEDATFWDRLGRLE
jgi:hypothetical protein